jgi:hypothetical protein
MNDLLKSIEAWDWFVAAMFQQSQVMWAVELETWQLKQELEYAPLLYVSVLLYVAVGTKGESMLQTHVVDGTSWPSWFVRHLFRSILCS